VRRSAGRAPLAVVVPTLDAVRGIGPCLRALAPGLTEGIVRELVFADGGSADGIEEVAEAAGARLVRANRGRGMQLAAGADAVDGEWLLFLHADSVLTAGWTDAVRNHIGRFPAAAGHFRLRYDDSGFGAAVVSAWANLRSVWFGLPYGDQGLLISRALYEEAGGFAALPLMEDVQFARRLGRSRLRQLDADIVTDFSRYREEGWMLRGARNLLCLSLYLLGVSPWRLLAVYRGRKR